MTIFAFSHLHVFSALHLHEQLRQEHAERSGAQLQSVLSAQGELQAQVLRLQQAALRSEADRDLAYSSSTSANAGQFAETKVKFLFFV